MIETRIAQIEPANVQVGDAAVLAANDLVYEISGVRLVNAVSLDLKPGDMVVVVGPDDDDVVNTIPVWGASVACCTTLPSRSV